MENSRLEREEIVCTIRNNGEYVGEQDSDELGECLLEKETRNIQQLSVEDIEQTEKLLDIFMGQEVTGRKQYILEHSEEAEYYA